MDKFNFELIFLKHVQSLLTSYLDSAERMRAFYDFRHALFKRVSLGVSQGTTANIAVVVVPGAGGASV